MPLEPPGIGDEPRAVVRETQRGRLAVWAMRPGIVVIQMVSHGDRAFADPIGSALERGFTYAPAVKLFWDLELLTSYDSELRIKLTSVVVRERRKVAEFHIVMRSKIVSMGVSVANLALGGMMTIHPDPSSFRMKLQDTIVHAGVAGFSLGSLYSQRRPV